MRVAQTSKQEAKSRGACFIRSKGAAPWAGLKDALLRPAKKLDLDFATSVPTFTLPLILCAHSLRTRSQISRGITEMLALDRMCWFCATLMAESAEGLDLETLHGYPNPHLPKDRTSPASSLQKVLTDHSNQTYRKAHTITTCNCKMP
jgi:hypothetical protein